MTQTTPDTIIEEAVMKTLKDAGFFERIAAMVKDATAGDVHVSSAIGGKKKAFGGAAGGGGTTKPLTFQEAMAEEEANDDVADDGGVTVADVEKANAPRILRPMSETMSHSPFPHDPDMLGKLRADQVPRFLGAISDPSNLETRSVGLNTLVSAQNRVDHDKVQAMAETDQPLKPAVVVRTNGRNYIADGHHRLAAAWLRGDTKADVHYLDLSSKNDAVKRDDDPVVKPIKKDWSIPFEIKKTNADQQLIFGWASIVEKDGKLVIDKQGDVILPDDLENAAYDFMLEARKQGDMHTTIGVGRAVESMVFTIEKQDALGVVLKDADGHRIVGWWVGFKVDSPDVWADHKAGRRPEFSIGGSGMRIPLD